MSFDPFENMRHGPKEKCENGILADDLAGVAYSLMGKLNGCGTDFTQVHEADRVPWKEVAALAIGTIDLRDEQATVELSAKAFGQALYTQYSLSRSIEAVWDSIPETLKLAWEAIGRHLANIIDSDGKVDVPELEERIAAWYEKRTCTVAA